MTNFGALVRDPPKSRDSRKERPMFRLHCPGLLLVPCFLVASWCNSQSVANPQASSLMNPTTALDVASSTNPAIATANAGTTVSPSLKAALVPADVLGDALLLYRRGNLDAAIEKYRLMLRTDPSSPDAHAGLARTYLKQGNVNLASETVNNGLKFSNSADLRVALGEVYFRQGKIPEAEQEWLSVINSGNANGRAYLGLARVRNALSQYAQGKAMIDKARDLDSVDPDIELNWNMTLPLAERIRRLESYLASPDSVGAHDRADSQHYLDYLKMLNNSSQGSCRLVNQGTKAEMPLVRLMVDAEHLRGYGLTVKMNGRKATLMLDTGASGILVSRKVAEKAGITKAAESRIAGVGDNGADSGYIGLASVVKIGDLEFQDCPVRVLDKSSILQDEGLIGTDIFEQFLVNLDFPQEKLRLSALPERADNEDRSADSLNSGFHDGYVAQGMQSYTKVYRFGHYLLVPTKVGNVSPKLFLLDTGGFLSQITPAAAREVTKLRADSERVVVGISGSVRNLYSAEKAILEFGRVRQANQDLTAFEISSASQSVGTEISGTLGFMTLHLLNIKIDYRDGLVDFDSRLANDKR
jgi:Flp pilus assembly protein TadD/predicted aspartyl protease